MTPLRFGRWALFIGYTLMVLAVVMQCGGFQSAGVVAAFGGGHLFVALAVFVFIWETDDDDDDDQDQDDDDPADGPGDPAAGRSVRTPLHRRPWSPLPQRHARAPSGRPVRNAGRRRA
jgi:hypothetical protein